MLLLGLRQLEESWEVLHSIQVKFSCFVSIQDMMLCLLRLWELANQR